MVNKFCDVIIHILYFDSPHIYMYVHVSLYNSRLKELRLFLFFHKVEPEPKAAARTHSSQAGIPPGTVLTFGQGMSIGAKMWASCMYVYV